MSDQKWFVVKTNPKAEKIVSKRLSEIGIVNYVPIRRKLKHWKDRKKWVDEVLFKGLIFVNTIEKSRYEVYKVFGVVRFMFFAKNLAIVTNKEIEILKFFCEANEIKIDKKGFDDGDIVEITTGPLIGMKGIMQKTQNGNKISIFIEQLGLFANINIDKSEVIKIT